MKTVEEYFKKYHNKDLVVGYSNLSKAITERDTEWTQKIQTALDKTSNWNCKEVLTKLLED